MRVSDPVLSAQCGNPCVSQGTHYCCLLLLAFLALFM